MIARARAMFKTARPDCVAPPTRSRPAAKERNQTNWHGKAAELSEIGMQRVAFRGEHHAGERTGEDQMAGLEPHTQRAELVGEPGDAERGMAEHAGGDAGLLDLGIAIHDAADPAQVDIERPDRPAADDDAGRRPVVGDGVEDLARVLQARIDDLDRRHHILGRAQHVGEAHAGAAQRPAEDEGDLRSRPAARSSAQCAMRAPRKTLTIRRVNWR